MRRRILLATVLAMASCCWFVAAASGGGSANKITFTKDIAPIFNSRCVECHRAGEIAPMSLTTYNEVRPWAKSIKEKVLSRQMPPWLADPAYGHFENDRRLSQSEIDTITAWVDAGAPKGEDKDLPATPKFEDGWTLGKPDMVISLKEDVPVPADGVIPYKNFSVPTNFKEDRWIQAAEIRPSNRKVVHHIIVFVQEPGAGRRGSGAGDGEGGGAGGYKLAGYAPGEQPKVFPKGTAKLIKAGSTLSFQMHYTPNGEAASDRSYIGLFFAKVPVEKKVLTGTAMNASFVIPAGDGNYEVRSSWTAKE